MYSLALFLLILKIVVGASSFTNIIISCYIQIDQLDTQPLKLLLNILSRHKIAYVLQPDLFPPCCINVTAHHITKYEQCTLHFVQFPLRRSFMSVRDIRYPLISPRYAKISPWQTRNDNYFLVGLTRADIIGLHQTYNPENQLDGTVQYLSFFTPNILFGRILNVNQFPNI